MFANCFEVLFVLLIYLFSTVGELRPYMLKDEFRHLVNDALSRPQNFPAENIGILLTFKKINYSIPCCN